MDTDPENVYDLIPDSRAGFYGQRRGLMAVWGKEAVQFLDGMITNDMKTLEDGGEMLAAFPNAQGRLLALVRVRRQGDKFLFETEETTREKLYQSLFRFTFAGDFLVEDVSAGYAYFEIFGPKTDVYKPSAADRWPGAYVYELPYGAGYFIPNDQVDNFRDFLTVENGLMALDDELYETVRIESGIPKYGVDVDETTIVPELGLEGMISYTKGCYIGQEIIARIHFRGHVAKRLTGLTSDDELASGAELTIEGKNAGRTLSATFSPKLDKQIALAFVRYDHLTAGTTLRVGDTEAVVTPLPFT